MKTIKKNTVGFVALLAAFALAVTGCATANSAEQEATMADQVTMSDAWVKAPTESMSTMTALFGTLTNNGNTTVVVTGGSSDIATMVQVHEVTAEGQMQEMKGGLKIAKGPGAESQLLPGENHIMLMHLTKTLTVGDEVTVTLKFKDGSTLKVTAPVKSAAGGEESYDESSEHEDTEM